MEVRELEELGLTVDETINLINKNTLKPLNIGDVFIFKVKLCSSLIDRENERMSVDFLKEFAELAENKAIPALFNHNWESVQDTQARLFKTFLIEGEGEPYVLGLAYTLASNTEFIKQLESGFLKEVSVGFMSEEDTCSLCGGAIDRDSNTCVNGHCIGGDCFVNLGHCKDALEFSFVSVPCNPEARVIKGLMGGIKMKLKDFNFMKFLKSKAYTDEEVKEVYDVEDRDINEDDIRQLIEENARLQEEKKALESELEEAKACGIKACGKAALESKLKEVNPEMHPALKELIMKEAPVFEVAEGGEVQGVEDYMQDVMTRFKGLIDFKLDAETVDASSDEDKDEKVEDLVGDSIEDAKENIDKIENRQKGLKASIKPTLQGNKSTKAQKNTSTKGARNGNRASFKVQ